MIEYKWVVLENIVTVTVTGATTAALYYFGAGVWSFLALVMLFNLNCVETSEEK